METHDHGDLISFLALAAVSLVGAVVLGLVGGGLAQVSNKSGTLLGFNFNASGGIAGFVIIFALSSRFVDRGKKQAANAEAVRVEADARKAAAAAEAAERLAAVAAQKAATDVRLRLRGKPSLTRSDEYEGECVITRASGGIDTVPIDGKHWDQALLVVELKDVHVDDWISGEIHNQDGDKWMVSDFSLHQPEVVAEHRRPAVTGYARRSTPSKAPASGDFRSAANREAKSDGPGFATVRKPATSAYAPRADLSRANKLNPSTGMAESQTNTTRD